jgi:hypothetical protein
MDVEFENENGTPRAVAPVQPRSAPWIVKKGYVKDAATADRLLIALMVVFFFLSATVLYVTLHSADANKSQIRREVVNPTTTY